MDWIKEVESSVAETPAGITTYMSKKAGQTKERKLILRKLIFLLLIVAAAAYLYNNMEINFETHTIRLNVPEMGASYSYSFSPVLESARERKTFHYTLRGEKGSITFSVDSQTNLLLSQKPQDFNCDLFCPTQAQIELSFINDETQRVELLRLVEAIKNKTTSRDDQARIAISLVQNIPYDWTGYLLKNQKKRYPYEVLYDFKGDCGEKSKLLAFILRELGYGVVLFNYTEHQTTGVKCPKIFSLNNSGYCFVDGVNVIIPTDIHGEYTFGSLPQVPSDTITVSQGASFESIEEEYMDAIEWNRLRKVARQNSNILPDEELKILVKLAEKYGIDIGQ